MPPINNAQEMLLSEITAVNRRVMEAFSSRQFVDLASCYTEEAQVLVARMDPICGRTSIASAFAFMRKRVCQLVIETRSVEREGDVAIEHGGYTHKAESGSVVDHGKYLVIWKRVQSEWLIHRDMLVSDLPVPP